jgi:uncharacterized membrane protein
MQDQIKLVITGISLCFGSDLRWKPKKPGESGEKLVLAAREEIEEAGRQARQDSRCACRGTARARRSSLYLLRTLHH